MSLSIFGKGHDVCTATHPDHPNFSGHARGRKLHLVNKEKKKGNRFMTFCGMLKDEQVTSQSVKYTVYEEEYRCCANCMSIADRKASL